MGYFVTISRGPRADRAEPFLALSDQQAVSVVLRVVRQLMKDGLADIAAAQRQEEGEIHGRPQRR